MKLIHCFWRTVKKAIQKHLPYSGPRLSFISTHQPQFISIESIQYPLFLDLWMLCLLLISGWLQTTVLWHYRNTEMIILHIWFQSPLIPWIWFVHREFHSGGGSNLATEHLRQRDTVIIQSSATCFVIWHNIISFCIRWQSMLVLLLFGHLPPSPVFVIAYAYINISQAEIWPRYIHQM